MLLDLAGQFAELTGVTCVDHPARTDESFEIKRADGLTVLRIMNGASAWVPQCSDNDIVQH